MFCDWKLFRTMDWTQVYDLRPADYTTTTTTTTAAAAAAKVMKMTAR